MSEPEENGLRPEETQPPETGSSENNSQNEIHKLHREAADWRGKLRQTESELENLRKEYDTLKNEREAQEQQELVEQGKFKELAEKSTARVAELEAQIANAERIEAALGATLETQRDGLPEYIIELLNQLSPVDQLDWLAKNSQSLKAPPAPGRPTSPSFNPPTSPPQRETDQEIVARLRRVSGQQTSPFG